MDARVLKEKPGNAGAWTALGAPYRPDDSQQMFFNDMGLRLVAEEGFEPPTNGL
jgi:hypothetical protein